MSMNTYRGSRWWWGRERRIARWNRWKISARNLWLIPHWRPDRWRWHCLNTNSQWSVKIVFFFNETIHNWCIWILTKEPPGGRGGTGIGGCPPFQFGGGWGGIRGGGCWFCGAAIAFIGPWFRSKIENWFRFDELLRRECMKSVSLSLKNAVNNLNNLPGLCLWCIVFRFGCRRSFTKFGHQWKILFVNVGLWISWDNRRSTLARSFGFAIFCNMAGATARWAHNVIGYIWFVWT